MKLVALMSLALFAACGGSPKPTTTTTPPTGDGSAAGSAATVVLPDAPFDSLDHDQRIAFMKQKVVPTLKPLFQNHDAKKYGEFGCKTCHGKGADTDHYDMPNAELPKLDFNDMSKFKKEDVEWMAKEIKPTMAKLLQQPEMTKENPKGFGCLECHTMVEAKKP